MKRRIVIACIIPTSPLIILLISFLVIPTVIVGLPYLVRRNLLLKETVISKKIGAWVFKILLWTLTILTVLISPLVGVVTSIVVIPLTALLVYVLIPLDLWRPFLRGGRRGYADDDGSENMSLVSNTEILNGLQNEDGEMAVFKSKEDEGEKENGVDARQTGNGEVG